MVRKTTEIEKITGKIVSNKGLLMISLMGKRIIDENLRAVASKSFIDNSLPMRKSSITLLFIFCPVRLFDFIDQKNSRILIRTGTKSLFLLYVSLKFFDQ